MENRHTVLNHHESPSLAAQRSLEQAWDEDNSGWIDTGELRRVLKAPLEIFGAGHLRIDGREMVVPNTG